MKKVLIALLLCCMVFGLAACANTDKAPDGMKDVAIESADYHLYVPEAWIDSKTLGISGAHAGAADAAFSPNVIVTVYYPDAVTDAATHFTATVKPQLALALDDLTMLEEGRATTLGGKDAFAYTYTYTLGGVAYKQMQVLAVNRYCVYSLTYTATLDRYDTYVGEVDTIVAAFTFK